MRHKLVVVVVFSLYAAPSWALDRGAVYRVWPRVHDAARPIHQIEFGPIEDRELNAFARPDLWQVYINTGLVDALQTDDQLAWVLAHEAAHVTKQHRPEKMLNRHGRKPFLTILGGVAGYLGGKSFDSTLIGVTAGEALGYRKPLLPILGGTSGYFLGGNDAYSTMVGAGVGTGLMVLHWNRGQEREADTEANAIVAAAGYDPAAGSQVMDILSKRGNPLPVWLSSHPKTRERKENNQKWLAVNPGAYQPQIAQARYQPVAATPAKRKIIVQFDGSIADATLMRLFLQTMAASTKIQIIAYGGDREEIKRALIEFGIVPKFTAPKDIWIIGMAPDYRYGSNAYAVSTPLGGFGYFRVGDKLVAALVATPYQLETGLLQQQEALYATGEARVTSGSSTSVWLPQGAIYWDTQRARSYPQGEAFRNAAVSLLQQFEAIPPEKTQAEQPKIVTPEPQLTRTEQANHYFMITPDSYATLGEIWTIVEDGIPVGRVRVVRVEGLKVYCTLVEGRVGDPNKSRTLPPN